MLFVECCFQLVYLGVVLVEINHLVFRKELVIEDSLPTSPYTQHHLLWIKTSLWCGWWWFISLAPRSLPFHIIVQYPRYIVTICFKNGTFLRLSRESPAEIRRRFFCLTYVEPKHQSDSHNQDGTNDFQHLIWIFWVCRLSPTWYNVDCSQLMSRFDRYQLPLAYPTMEHGPARNL